MNMKWSIPHTRYQDAEQEHYVKNLGWHTAGMQTADIYIYICIYSIWSATAVKKLLSVHTRNQKEYTKDLPMGQKAKFMYGRRPKHEKEDTYRDTDLGILIELHKQLTSIHRWQHKSTPEEGEQLLQHIAHLDYMIDEINRLVPKLPSHKDMGMEETAKQRLVAAVRQARNFSIPQLQTLI